MGCGEQHQRCLLNLYIELFLLNKHKKINFLLTVNHNGFSQEMGFIWLCTYHGICRTRAKPSTRAATTALSRCHHTALEQGTGGFSPGWGFILQHGELIVFFFK